MTEKTAVKPEALPDLDDLLQCPVCYEIPTGQIFQCNEGHHVCGRCKIRLDVCPVCRAMFFGTRNYAMEELIANIRKLRAFKLGGKVTTGSSSSERNSPTDDLTLEDIDNVPTDAENNLEVTEGITLRAPPACKGLFRCLCCKNGNGERLPSARLLNHLRYFHASELIEGQSESGEYMQAWQFSTVPGRIVTAVRISDMGIFFLIIEINLDSVYAWLSMAAAPSVAREFSYSVTISGNDREAIFSDCVWSVRSCEGSLKKRGHCLAVSGTDARSLTAPTFICGKLSLRRTPADHLAGTQPPPPRAVLRVASRAPAAEAFPSRAVTRAIEPDAAPAPVPAQRHIPAPPRPAPQLERPVPPPPVPPPQPLSRNARRRMRQRLRAALEAPAPQPILPPQAPHQVFTGFAMVHPVPPVASSSNSNSSQNSVQPRTNKKKRRQRR